MIGFIEFNELKESLDEESLVKVSRIKVAISGAIPTEDSKKKGQS
jgi:hypothetical protein